MTQLLDNSEITPAPVVPAGRRFDGLDQRAPLREALRRWGHLGPGQAAGRFFPAACVALEITQRCNLDCTLCYLSDRAEAAHDVPLTVLYERVRMFESHYGPHTNVQITGGDPTLRAPEDLEALCRFIRSRGLRSCLMTNGIKASRGLLERLAAAGLDDVAFHVDLTQERDGYPTEASLNAVRAAYLARARGLGLRVLFNTTVFDGNLAELPALAAFFRDHAAEITLASFQLQADTGRGVLRERADVVDLDSVSAGLADGVGAPLDFDVAGVGHPDCTRFASVLVAGDAAASLLSDRALIHEIFAGLERVEQRSGLRRDAYLDVFRMSAALAAERPGLLFRAIRHALGRLWRIRRGIWRSGGRTARLTFLLHNFMDAERLERERCETCVFMVGSEDGPLSMCVHNARRDAHLFQPARVETPAGPRWWRAGDGRLSAAPDPAAPPEPTALKRLKGRRRAQALQARPARDDPRDDQQEPHP